MRGGPLPRQEVLLLVDVRSGDVTFLGFSRSDGGGAPAARAFDTPFVVNRGVLPSDTASVRPDSCMSRVPLPGAGGCGAMSSFALARWPRVMATCISRHSCKSGAT